MLNIAICGNDQEQNEYIRMLAETYITDEPVRTVAFDNTGAFINFMDARGFDMHIVITDVALGEFNGIKLMRIIQERLPDLQIIFASKFKELVFDAYAVRHVAFIPFPIDRELFRTAVMMAEEAIRLRRRAFLVLARGGLISRIDLDEVLYLESEGRTLNVHTLHGLQSFPRQLESVKPLLDNRFVQCHKSYIANMDYVISLDSASGVLTLRDGCSVPVSARKVKETRDVFSNFIAQY